MISKRKKPALPSPEAAPPAPLALPRFGSFVRLCIYPLSVLAPDAGIVLGLLYARQEEKEARNFGRICLALGLLGALLRAMHSTPPGDTLNQPLY